MIRMAGLAEGEQRVLCGRHTRRQQGVYTRNRQKLTCSNTCAYQTNYSKTIKRITFLL
jgi:hypothetical protein